MIANRSIGTSFLPRVSKEKGRLRLMRTSLRRRIEALMRSALRGGVPSPSRQPTPFRIVDQKTIPSRITLFGGSPLASVSVEARSSTALLVPAPLAGIAYSVVGCSLPNRCAKEHQAFGATVLRNAQLGFFVMSSRRMWV